MATGQGTATTDAAQGKGRKTVPLKVVVLIDAKTKGVSEGATIKRIETLRDAAVAKKSLDDVKKKDGKEVKRLNGTFVVKDAKITPADDGVVGCQVLVAVEPGKTTLRDVKYVSTLRAVSDKEAGTWYGYTAVFDTPAPEDEAGANAAQAKKDIEALQGTWRVISSQVGDEKASADEVAKRKVTVKGNVLTYDYGNGKDRPREGTLKLDPKTKSLDWIVTFPESGRMLAIYELKGDDLKIGFGNDGQVRPRRWVIGKDDVVWLLVLKREKP
jgi:uncharacterized protein (TIGR03067 family)